MDFAVLRVAPTRGGTGDDIGAIGAMIGSDPVEGQVGFVIHHPLCKPKKATVTGCKVDKVKVPGWSMPDGSAVADSDFYHTCDTDTGSSGAPVFDATGKVIGLHHLGFGEPQACLANPVRKNRAVRIEAILDDLKANDPDVHAELTADVH
jgi:S1-C subfamily serine protease